MRARLGMSLVLAVLFLAAVVVGCSPTTPPSTSAQPTASPGESAESALPPGCEPLELRSADGTRIELDGPWVEVVEVGEPMTWWIRTQGDCVWGSGQIDDVPPREGFGARPDQVQSLNGAIGSDFVITGEILYLGPLPVGVPGTLTPYSPLRMLIEFGDTGEILLREDREAGVVGPRCPDPVSYCPTQLVLQPAEE